MTQSLQPVNENKGPDIQELTADVGGRSAPTNFEAEQGLLGALLINNAAIEKVADFLLPEHFADAAHGRIYYAVNTLIDRGHIANPVTLKNFFDQDDTLSEVGGAHYLKDLADNVVGVVNVADYGRAVHEMYLRRQLIGLGEEIVNQAFEHDLDNTTDTQIESAEKKLYDLATTGDFKGGFKDFENVMGATASLIEAAYKNKGALTGLSTGLKDLDARMGGLNDTDLLILAGRPSMGKTALATNIAHNIARRHMLSEGKEGGVIGFFSLEMSAEQLANRILSEQVEIPSNELRQGKLNTQDMERVIRTARDMGKTPLYIDDTPALTVSALRTRARRLKRQYGLDCIVVDYLQLINGASKNAQANRVQEISEITRGLKTLAKELNVPVLALSQLSRQVEQRDDKRPQLADLRESGSIEQDADIVMFVYRESYYLEREGDPVKKPNETPEAFQARREEHEQRIYEKANVAEIIIAKQRHGAVGTVALHFNGFITKFSDYIADDHLPAHH